MTGDDFGRQSGAPHRSDASQTRGIIPFLPVLPHMSTRFRLLCSAVLLAAAAGAHPLHAQASATYGSFSLEVDKDPMSDADRSGLYAGTDRDGIRQPLLGWRCMEDGLNVMYMWDKYFIGSDDEVEVMFRFDTSPASPFMSWTVSTDHKAGFAPMSMVTEFTRQAIAGGRLTLRVRDSDGEVLTDSFSLSGLGQGLPHLSCAAATSATAAR